MFKIKFKSLICRNSLRRDLGGHYQTQIPPVLHCQLQSGVTHWHTGTHMLAAIAAAVGADVTSAPAWKWWTPEHPAELQGSNSHTASDSWCSNKVLQCQNLLQAGGLADQCWTGELDTQTCVSVINSSMAKTSFSSTSTSTKYLKVQLWLLQNNKWC